MIPPRSKAIPGFKAYRVDRFGTVWSCFTCKGNHAKIGKGWKQLKPVLCGSAGKYYFGVTLCTSGQQIRKKVHLLVLETFREPRPPKMFGCHDDDNKFNNRLSNLHWKTPSQNRQDQEKNGNGRFGENNPSAVLNDAAVIEMRQLREYSKLTFREIAEQFGVKESTAYAAIVRNNWKRVV